MAAASETSDTAQAQLALAEERIAELTRENAALRGTAEMLRSIVESSPDGIVLVDEQGRIVEWNRGEEEITGLSRAEVLGQPLWDVQLQAMPEDERAPGTREQLKAAILAAVRGGPPPAGKWSREHRLKRADGRCRMVQDLAFVVGTSRGFMLGAISRDMTERERAEEALRDSESMLRSIVESSPDGIVLIDEQGRIVEWNRGEEEISGLSRAEVLGRPLWDVQFQAMPDEQRGLDTRERLKAGILAALRSGLRPVSERSGEHRLRRADGAERVVHDLVFAVPKGKGFMLGGISRDVTERQRAEEALRDSESKLRGIVDNSLDGVVVIDENGTVVEWNRGQEEITGVSAAEALGRTLWEVQFELAPEEMRTPALYQYIKAITLDALESGQPPSQEWTEERTVRRADGSRRTMQAMVFPIRTERGTMLASINRDTTERRRAEEALRFLGGIGSALASSLDYEATLEAAAHLAVPTLADWCVVDIVEPGRGSRAVTLAHVDPEKERQARELHERLPFAPERFAPYRDVLRTAQPTLLAEVPPPTFQALAQGPEQLESVRAFAPVSLMLVPLVARGRTLGVIWLASAESGRRYGAQDLALAEEMARRAAVAVDNARLYREAEAARAMAEHLLDEAQRRAAELDAAIASIPDGFIIYGPEGEILRINKAAARMTGLAPGGPPRTAGERVVGMELETADGQPLPPDELPVWRALRGETLEGVLLAGQHEGRRRWVSVSGAPIRADYGRLLGAIVAFTDVTALRELQEQRDDLLRAVSHDLRGPLAAVKGQAQLLLRRLDTAGAGARGRHSAEAIVTAAERMNTMIQGLVDAARMESAQLELSPQALDLGGFIRQLLERSAGTLGSKRIRLEAPAELPAVLADPARLERILENLLSNALKYATPGTPITVTVYAQGAEVVTSVADEGPGIAASELRHLFERYYRAKAGRERGGLGLGLYITKGLVEAQMGRIWAESEPRRGSTFSFSLPVAT